MDVDTDRTARLGPSSPAEDAPTTEDALTAEVAEAERRLREARAALDRARGEAMPARLATPRRTGDRSRAPLSFAQEQLWFLDQMAPGRPTYHLPVVLGLTGSLDLDALRHALTGVVKRHESLRTTFAVEGGRPYQLIHPPGPVPLPVEDLPGDRPEACRAALDAEVRAPFDLATDLMIRARLFRLGPEEHVLCLTLNHICSDGWSARIVLRDLGELYEAARTGRAANLPELPIQYGDFAQWQQDQARDGVLDHHLDYWAQRLAGAPVLDFPTDRPRPPAPSNRGAPYSHRVPADVLEGVRSLCRATGANLFAALAAAINVVVARYSGSEDVVLGRPSAGRLRPELDDLVGFFANMVVLRTDLSGDPPFTEVLRRTMAASLEAWDHQAAPFEKVVARLGLPRDPSRNPIFQIATDLEVGSSVDFRLGELETEFLSEADPGAARFDLGLKVYEQPEGLLFRVEYATDLFDEPRIARLLGHIEQVLRSACIDPELPLSRLPMLTEAERRQVLQEWQGPNEEEGSDPVHAQVTARAARHPDLPAARHGDETLSYRDLDRRAGALAGRLRAMGVRHQDVVAIALGPGFDVLVATLGVLKAGAAFVPVDANHPRRRVGFILADTAAKVVVTRSDLLDLLPEPAGWAPLLIDQGTDPAGPSSDPWEEWARPDSLAYVLYTSGSTGRPKGVMVEHHALATFLQWFRGVLGLGPGDRSLQHMALIFDFAIGELLGVLSAGATLVFVPEELRASPEAIGGLAARERVTHLFGTPAILGAVRPGDLPELRAMIVGGEPIPGELVNRWNVPGRLFINGYGPTEATIGCTFYACEGRSWTASPPIGRAMPNRTAYILDRWGGPAPVGVPGEIVVGGAGLARGYLNLPELTAERFVEDPFRPGGRVYRTGDLGAWTEDGQIRFLGRIDTQVKLNGLRVELEEIESVLLARPGVAEAVVVLRQDERGAKLVAYVVPADGGVEPSDLRSSLGQELPFFMIPNAFVVLDRLPLSPTGKVDRAALPPPGQQAQSSDGEAAAPRTGAEEDVAAAFAEVLGVAQVGANDDFFALGGSSLQAARVVLKLSELAGTRISVRDFFSSPRVSDVARLIAPDGESRAGDEEALAAGVAEAERRLEQARVQLERGRTAAAAPGAAGSRAPVAPAAPAGGLPPRPATRGAEILLTGATGFFGAFLLHELLAQHDGRVHCLVRAADDDEARERLRANLAAYGRERQDWSRVSVLRGDLGLPLLGLGDEGFDRLARLVDTVYHNGAQVGGLFPYERLQGVNVGGTEELLRLAATTTSKELHYVSSLSAGWLDPDGALADRVPGYVASKWRAERLVMEAAAGGAPVSIFRLPRLVGDSRTGRGNDRDVVMQLLRRFVEMGVAADIEGSEVWIPVDEAAWVLVRTAIEHPGGGLFVMTAPSRVRIRHVLELASETGHPLDVVPVDDWMREVASRSAEEQELMAAIFAANAAPVPAGSAGGQGGAEFETVLARGVDDSLLARYLDDLASKGERARVRTP